MTLGEKMQGLRRLEGELRGLGREMSQQEVARSIRDDLGGKVSQSYLSQIESGRRRHLSHSTRLALARFFQVHPGYLVDDPEGFSYDLQALQRHPRHAALVAALREAAARAGDDAALRDALLGIAGAPDPRRQILLAARLVEMPALADRLLETVAGGTP
jgi:transcriptional regulator with XRE-family HTH domain